MMKVGVSVILYNSKCEFLLGKRRGAHGQGTYANPGGKPEGDEQHIQTAIREVMEETGIDISDRSVEDFGFVCITADNFDDSEPYQTYHYAIMIDDDVRAELREPDKCEELGFYDPLDILRMYTNGDLFLPLQNLLKELDIQLFQNMGAYEIDIPSRDIFMNVFRSWLDSHPYAGNVYLFSGPAGSGKGTQGKIIQDRLKIPHISTGEMFRRLSQENTEKGQKIKGHMDRGEIIPPDLAFSAVRAELSSMRYKLGFILDGYPKDLESMEFLLGVLRDNNMKIDTVFYFDMAYELNQMVRNSTCVPQEDRIASETCLNVLAERLCQRLLCKSCELNYHPVHSPPKVENTCDACGNELIYRSDDQDMQTVKKRIDVFRTNTLPVITELEKRGVRISRIDACLKIPDVTEDIVEHITNSPRDQESVHILRPVLQTVHHSHLDGKNLALLEDIIHSFHSGESSRSTTLFTRSEKDNLRQKVYPVQYLSLSTQARSLPEIYMDLDNFHEIAPNEPDESPEAFVTMMYGKKANYAYMTEMLRFLRDNANEINERHRSPNKVIQFESEKDMLNHLSQSMMCDKQGTDPAIQFEYEEEIHSSVVSNVLDPYSEGRIEFDVITMESIQGDAPIDYVIADRLRTFRVNSVVHNLDEFEEYAVQNVPMYELHFGFDIPKVSGETEPPIDLDTLKKYLEQACAEDVPIMTHQYQYEASTRIFELGGIFIFEKEDRWAYRTNQFYDGDYYESRRLLTIQGLYLTKLLNSLLGARRNDISVPLKASVEIVHKIWRFD